jgi:arginase
VNIHAIAAPYDLDRRGLGSGAGPEALLAHHVLEGFATVDRTTIEIETTPFSQVQFCIAVDAAIANAVAHARSAGSMPVVLAGNCHSCLGTLAGIGERTGITWFDAHGDLNTPDTTETGYFDGMALANALGWGWHTLTRQIPGFRAANATDTILIGGRDLDPAERTVLEQSGVAHYLPQARNNGTGAEFDAALDNTALPRSVYVHLDLDVLDPSELHANRFNVPGGVSAAWMEDALRKLRQRHDIAAVGVTAYDPSYTAAAKAAPIVNRLLRALLHTGP